MVVVLDGVVVGGAVIVVVDVFASSSWFNEVCSLTQTTYT